jgi:hypothetical protein
MNILDSFRGVADTFVQHGSGQGTATVEQPTSGARPRDVQNILGALSGLFGEVSSTVNAFSGTVENGRQVQTPVGTMDRGGRRWLWAGLALVAVGAAWWFLKRKG